MSQPNIRFIIIDDNEIDRMTLKALTLHYQNLSYLGSFENPIEGLNAIKVLQPELVFLDIEMPDFSGLEIQKTIQDLVPMTVFVTSHPEYALDGFELMALDYILKPTTEARLQQCLEKVKSYWEMKQKSSAYDVLIEKDKLTIKQGHDKIFIAINDIIYLEAMNDYTKLYTKEKSYITLSSLTNFLKNLPVGHFQRTHRSFAVAKSKITALRKKEVLCENFAIPLSISYREALESLF